MTSPLWARMRRTGRSSACGVADLGVREALIADLPDVYFTFPHFDGYPAVLVRLGEISAAELEEVISEGWLDRAPKRLAREYLASRTPPTERARTPRTADRSGLP